MKIGFIGLGNVGGKLAESLLRNKFDLTVRDLDNNLTNEFKAKGVKVANSPKELAEEVDLIITCLPSPKICSEVMTELVDVTTKITSSTLNPWFAVVVKTGVSACCEKITPVTASPTAPRTKVLSLTTAEVVRNWVVDPVTSKSPSIFTPPPTITDKTFVVAFAKFAIIRFGRPLGTSVGSVSRNAPSGEARMSRCGFTTTNNNSAVVRCPWSQRYFGKWGRFNSYE